MTRRWHARSMAVRTMPTNKLALTTLVLAASCGGNSLSEVHCVESTQVAGVMTMTCVDTTGLTSDQVHALQSTCNNSTYIDAGMVGDASFGVMVTGTFGAGPCDHTGALGGCMVASGGYMNTIWYYTAPGLTASIAQTGCTATHGTWVEP
jgi:hypothetical protein